MSSIEQGEEKKLTLTPEFSDVSYNPMFAVRNNSVLRRNMFASIARRTARYARKLDVTDTWLHHNFYDAVHQRLGLGLDHIDMNVEMVNYEDMYRSREWNNAIVKLNNTLSYVLNERKKDLKKSTVKRMLTRNFPVDEVRGIIKETLEIMFDAEDPEVLDDWQRDTALEQVERDDIQSSMSIACFSVDDYKDTNACFLRESQYEVYLCHFFRTVVFHCLSFMKQFTGNNQWWEVSENLKLEVDLTPKGKDYWKVNFDFVIVRKVDNDGDSSDEDSDEEDDDSVSLHDYRSRAEENTFQMSLHADRSVGMYQPLSFTRIVQTVDEGVVISELEQMIRMRDTLNGIILAQQQIQRDVVQQRVLSDEPFHPQLSMRNDPPVGRCPHCIVEPNV